jgi:hypothetical protein
MNVVELAKEWLKYSKSDLTTARHMLEMVKDFYADSDFNINNTFMTNADIPYIATTGIIENVTNPFTSKKLLDGKTKGVTITTATLTSPWIQNKYSFKINKDEWLHVHDDIFNLENWTSVIIEQ